MTCAYAALVHYPVRDRQGYPVTSAITNIDVHDLARSARAYGLRGYYVVSPIAAQREIVERILEHWRTGEGSRRVPERTEALALCRAVESVEAAENDIATREGEAPELFVTAARPPDGVAAISWESARERVGRERPALLLFGTAHGLHPVLMSRASAAIAPIDAGQGWNHLSVRAAAAITFDRLFAASR